ncbi:MAG TPA: DinB family protein [Longimicrobium sp.]
MSTHTKVLHFGVRAVVLRAAELMPESGYSFRPVATVRTFGQLVGHIADSQYLFCSGALGEQEPAHRVEQTVTTKAGLIAALRQAYGYCDRAYGMLNDANAAQIVSSRGVPTARMNALGSNEVHTTLHYGNIVTYLRMNGITPPSTDLEWARQLRPAQRP